MAWTATGGGDHEGSDWIISSATTISGDHYNIGKFQVESGQTATLQQGSNLEIHCETLDIDGTLTGNAKGNINEAGSGAGSGPSASSNGGGGGAYGGDGADGAGVSGGAGGSAYGSSTTTTVQMGSGGGDDYYGAVDGGYGGGCVLVFCDSVNVSGTISCDGGDGAGSSGENSGGGSGGGILIVADDVTVEATGSITANGGSGGTDPSNYGGKGGGGRIKVFYYTSYSNSGTVQAIKGTNGNDTGAADGTVTTTEIACDSSYAFGQEFTTAPDYSSAVTAVKLYVEKVNTSGDFTLKIWDSPSKSTEKATKSITVSGTGEATWTFASTVVLDANTTYYLEVNPDASGDIQLAINAYEDTIGQEWYYAGNEMQGLEAYLKLVGYGHIVDPIVYNTADTTTQCQVCNTMLSGAVHQIDGDGTGHIDYDDDFTNDRYLADNSDVSNATYDSVNDELDIANTGYIYYYLDTRYPITGVPTLTATIDITNGSPTIQISTDGSTWYNIDDSIVDNVSTEYELDCSSLHLKKETAFYFRIDCANGACSLKTFNLDVDILTIDARHPLINTGGANTFQCDQGTNSSIACAVALIYADRKWG